MKLSLKRFFFFESSSKLYNLTFFCFFFLFLSLSMYNLISSHIAQSKFDWIKFGNATKAKSCCYTTNTTETSNNASAISSYTNQCTKYTAINERTSNAIIWPISYCIAHTRCRYVLTHTFT